MRVLESRIDPPQRLVAGQRPHDSPQLGTAVSPGQREPQRAQVAADGLQLADDRPRVEAAVRALDELAQALAAGADIVLLDNMEVAALRKAVVMTGGRALLEASGGVTLESVADIAATGVDLISVGALTHSAPALDISLELDLAQSGQNPSQ